MTGLAVLAVPSEEALFSFLTALNVSGLHPELACSAEGGTPFLAGLTEPDADHVHVTVTEADSGTVHCCECSHPGQRPDQWDPNSWAPTYPVQALVARWPDAVRVAEEDYIDAWWLVEAPGVVDPPRCEAHLEVQHRDRQPPWCNACGWNRGRPARAAQKLGDPR